MRKLLSRRNIVLAVLGLCGFCTVVGVLAPSPEEGTEGTEPNGTRVVEVELVEENTADVVASLTESEEDEAEPTEEASPTAEPTETDTPEPTVTTEPTNTPRPSPTPAAEVEVNSSSVNLRGGPGIEYESVGTGFDGDVFEVIATNEDGSWYNIEIDGGSAWIGASVVEQVNEASFTAIKPANTIPAPPQVVVQPTAAPTTAPVATNPPATAVPAAAPTEAPPPTAPPAPSAAQVVIIRVDKGAEFVDIQNTGGSPQDLSGWNLVSERGNQDCPLGGTLEAGATLRIWARAEDSAQGGWNCGHGGNIWNNSESDPAVLYDNAGNVVSRR